MAPPPAPLAAPNADAPSLKSALLIIGGLLLFVVAAIVLFRYLRRRCSASSGPRRASSEAEGGAAAGREHAEAGEAATTAAAAGREQVEAVRIAAAVGRAEARPATERVEVEGERRDAGAAAAGDEDTELLIASLPLFTMASALAALPKNSPDCAVCLSAFEPEDWLRLLPACRHAFHAACIDAWLRTSPACPICRAAVSSPLPPLPSAPSAAGAGGAGQEPLDDSRWASSRSFRVELGSVSNRRLSSCSAAAGGGDGSWRRTYSLGGSFDYRVDEEVEAIISRIVRPAEAAAAATAGPRLTAPSAPGEALAEAVGSRGWLGEYLDRVAASASSLSARWSGRRLSHGRRHDDSWRWDPEATAAAAAKSATTPGEEVSAEARGMGEFRDRDNLGSSASTLSGRWSWRWSLGRNGDRRGESWRWDPEAACGAPREEEREPALVALGRWILGF
ncbi:unnamed protein product [Urochloa decumbens]|uniref:RING-type domain-containing protein n=1 Tax=Urochloa decumbens TaxID=240449 RepID=A0ABC8W9F9_9POAL